LRDIGCRGLRWSATTAGDFYRCPRPHPNLTAPPHAHSA
jgi:hypothetical protein